MSNDISYIGNDAQREALYALALSWGDGVLVRNGQGYLGAISAKLGKLMWAIWFNVDGSQHLSPGSLRYATGINPLTDADLVLLGFVNYEHTLVNGVILYKGVGSDHLPKGTVVYTDGKVTGQQVWAFSKPCKDPANPRSNGGSARWIGVRDVESRKAQAEREKREAATAKLKADKARRDESMRRLLDSIQGHQAHIAMGQRVVFAAPSIPANSKWFTSSEEAARNAVAKADVAINRSEHTLRNVARLEDLQYREEKARKHAITEVRHDMADLDTRIAKLEEAAKPKPVAAPKFKVGDVIEGATVHAEVPVGTVLERNGVKITRVVDGFRREGSLRTESATGYYLPRRIVSLPGASLPAVPVELTFTEGQIRKALGQCGFGLSGRDAVINRLKQL